ncbi:hypothetical protein ASPNIDRAFT_125931 [Aspergillus niger ATCC 1015]|uniref:Uncharacterized protein n=1 Tax=Aspergillus niger (strain ATCC 1015 / CBS 113.46 / FGSC A1144 / LSHB Ac4 / NCTC 3858a / NRRL 328 / USDA 3528.7) TaxID=380704 RepID=G3YHN4_ASPNA|nr:hypothetical protein ASPNIDRAFT_125931 [Aspergillus niger ATCC 1015]
MAADRGSIEMVRSLVECGWYVNEVDVEGRTPLHCAAENGHDPVVQVLLANEQLDVNARDHRKSTALHEAAWKGYLAVANLLLTKSNVDINVEIGNLPMVELLLSRSDVRVNSAEQNEQPPLWSAASQGHIQVVERLLQCGDIEVNQGWGPYSSPLLAAITRGHSGVAMRLLNCVPRPDDWQTDRNGADRQGRTALWWAARAGQAQIVQRLLEDDRVLIDVMDNDGVDAMGAARSYYHFEVVWLIRTHYFGRYSNWTGGRPHNLTTRS